MSLSRRQFLQQSAVCLAGYGLTTSMSGCASGSLFGAGEANSLALIHITDTHLDLAKPETSVWLRRFVERVNQDYSSTDFVLFGGDNFNNNTPGNADAVQFKEIADGLHCPWYAVRGNKEASPKPAGDPLNQADFGSMFFGDDLQVIGRNWRVQKGNFTILGLDSTIDGHNNGLYDLATLNFVESELTAHPDSTYILLNHHAYLNYWQSTDTRDIHKYVLNNREDVAKRFFAHPNLKLTLSGHKHRNDLSEIGGAQVMSTVGFKVPQGKEKDHQFRLITMADGAITTTIGGIV